MLRLGLGFASAWFLLDFWAVAAPLRGGPRLGFGWASAELRLASASALRWCSGRRRCWAWLGVSLASALFWLCFGLTSAWLRLGCGPAPARLRLGCGPAPARLQLGFGLAFVCISVTSACLRLCFSVASVWLRLRVSLVSARLLGRCGAAARRPSIGLRLGFGCASASAMRRCSGRRRCWAWLGASLASALLWLCFGLG